MKDRFSDKASGYAAFRPSYPDTLFNYLYTHLESFDTAWDAGTGNGQVAAVLAGKFNKVYATDISVRQLMKVPSLPNLSSFVADEAAPQIPDACASLVTVSQAIHWFDVNKFAQEVSRISQAGGILAVWGYGLIQIPAKWQQPLLNFYQETVGPYWDPERKHIDTSYANIALPFREIPVTEDFKITGKWTPEHLQGYLNTWSSVGNYTKEKGIHPVPELIDELADIGLPKQFPISFSIFLRLYRVH